MKGADGKERQRSKQEQGATAINHSDIYQIGLGVEAWALGHHQKDMLHVN